MLLANDFEFTTDWFSRHARAWAELLARFTPVRCLEIGSYEGRAACFIIEQSAASRPVELHCVDTWAGGVEHAKAAMPAVEQRFDSNIALARSRAAHEVRFHKHKGLSSDVMVKLLADGEAGRFDLIYIDGSHQASDVLADAVLAFLLAKVGGLIIFDDYLWSMEGRGRQDFYNLPKPAIDAFVNIYQRKLRVFEAPLYQLYTQKLAN